MFKYTLTLLATFFCIAASAQQKVSIKDIDYTKSDSAEVCKWLKEAKNIPDGESPIIWFGKKFLGRPYVAHTLEKNKTERLIINTREIDCTTFTENVMALELCRRHGKTSFLDFCQYLRDIRYEKGKSIDYIHRNHYFTGWANSNIAQGYFTEITKPENIFSATQTVFVNWMTKHPDSYKMIKETPSNLPGIAEMEKKLNGGKYKYIPKSALLKTNTKEFRNAIHDGDIVVILTNKPGLDTQHITIAYWHKEALHIMHASSIRKQVVDEPLSLYEYLQRQKTATGVRILRMK